MSSSNVCGVSRKDGWTTAALGSDADLVAVSEGGEFGRLPVHRGRSEAHRADVRAEQTAAHSC